MPPFLAALLAAFAKAVHVHWICSILRSNRLECELTSAGFNEGHKFYSKLLVRDHTCTVHKMMFQLTWDEGFERSCLDVFLKSCPSLFSLLFSRVAAPGPPTSRVPREGLVACTDLEPESVAGTSCAFLRSEDPNCGPNVAAPRDLVLLQGRRRSFRFLSKLRAQHGLARCISRISSTGSFLSRSNWWSASSLVMTVHPFDH